MAVGEFCENRGRALLYSLKMNKKRYKGRQKKIQNRVNFPPYKKTCLNV